MKNKIEYGIEDIKGFSNLEDLKNYVRIHYDVYSKETLMRMIYGVIEGVVPFRYITDKDIYKMFVECINEDFNLNWED